MMISCCAEMLKILHREAEESLIRSRISPEDVERAFTTILKLLEIANDYIDAAKAREEEEKGKEKEEVLDECEKQVKVLIDRASKFIELWRTTRRDEGDASDNIDHMWAKFQALNTKKVGTVDSEEFEDISLE
mmetsp:Transcript_19419/g.49782  ORF Transcript_19419/g.49782 Transcript_19419/m.49782 type:complete len:133 (+) Transcript_19419:1080-1478(+)